MPDDFEVNVPDNDIADPEDATKRGMRSAAEQAFVDGFVDRFKAQQAVLFAPAAPGGTVEKQQATMRAAAIMKAAVDTAKGFGSALEWLTPAKLGDAARQAADRAMVPIADGTLRLTSEAQSGQLVIAANAKPQEYTDALARMKSSAAAGPAQYIAFRQEIGTNDDPRLLMESYDFKQGKIEVKGASALHICATCGDADGVEALLLDGARVDSRDAAGNTPLHSIGFAKAATDDPAVVAKLIAGGARLSDKNRKGQTAVHLAAFGGKIEGMKELARDPNFTAANVADGRGWTPADMATAAGQNGTEDFLFANGHAVATNLLTPRAEQAKLSTVDILVKASKFEGPTDDQGNPTETPQATEATVRELFTELYRQPEFRSVLDLAAADALGKRNDPRKGLRIFLDFNSDIAGGLTGKGGRGAFDDRSNTLVLGAKRPPKELRGTTVHELTHHAAEMVFGNQAVPYDDENSAEAVAYRAAIEADFRVAQTFIGGTEAEVAYTMGGRMNEYRRAALGLKRLPLLQEYLAGVPQVIAEHGLEYARKVAPSMTAFFCNEFAGKCDDTLGADARFSAVTDNAALLGGLAPVPAVDVTSTTWMEMRVDGNGTVTLGEGDKERSFYLGVEMRKVHAAMNGVTPPNYPPSVEYAAVQGLPKVFDWSYSDMTTSEDAEISDSNLVNLIQRRFRLVAHDFPREVAATTLEKLIGNASAALDGYDATRLEWTVDDAVSRTRDTVRQARLDYLPRAKATGALTPELVAYTVIYEAACQALESDPRRDNRVAGAGPDLNVDKIDELVDAMIAKMTPEQMNKLADDPARVAQMATGLTGSMTTGRFIKTTVMNGFYTKKVKGTDRAAHVSLKVDEAKKRWVRELATL